MDSSHTRDKGPAVSLLFDSSALINLITEEKIELFIDHYTVPLARYEIGNVLWQNVTIRNKLKPTEGEEMYRRAMNALDQMQITENDSWGTIFKLAVKEKIAFYDAAYLSSAINYGLPLVTDDFKLSRVGGNYTRVLSSSELN